MKHLSKVSWIIIDLITIEDLELKISFRFFGKIMKLISLGKKNFLTMWKK